MTGKIPSADEGSYQQTETGLSPSLNRVPANLHHIHLMGICGAGMASLAGILKQKHFLVTGSDQNVYPPMSDFLQALSIPIMQGYSPDNLRPEPDLVIVGNVITRANPEAMELSRLNIPYLSFPQALKHFAFKEKQPVVISGTHGKTTTCALGAWILDKAGLDPGFMIGGIPQNFQKSFKLGKGPYFLIEGDEYDTAFFDKGPKFLHYSPWITILTSIEFDHADIYRNLDHVVASFRKLIDLIPPDGFLIANGDDLTVKSEIKRARCTVTTYGFAEGSSWRGIDLGNYNNFTRFKILKAEQEYANVITPLYGRHNMSNILATVILADHLEIQHAVLSKALKSFQGVKRRLEIIGEKRGILVLDDFAHHPTAVKETIKAVRKNYEGRRIIAVFEPRSNSSRRNIFQIPYASSFDEADIVMIPEPPPLEKIPLAERLSSKRLVEDLKKKKINAFSFPDTRLLLEGLVKEVRSQDVILFMSNGGFDNIHQRLLKRL